MTISLLGVSLPTFLIGILLILVFAVTLKWLPSFGRGEVVALRTVDHRPDQRRRLAPPGPAGDHAGGLPAHADHAAGSLGDARGAARRLHQVRARPRPLRPIASTFGHALKNTLVPVMTITGLQLGGLIAFAIITETVFQWPGMGLLFIQAVQFADIPVMAAYLCLIALIFVVINLVVDLLYFAVDPRLRVERTAGAH